MCGLSSQWDGDFGRVAEARTPVYFAIGERDEYYSSKPAKEAYEELVTLYEQAGLDKEAIQSLAVLDVKEKRYFTDRCWIVRRGDKQIQIIKGLPQSLKGYDSNGYSLFSCGNYRMK